MATSIAQHAAIKTESILLQPAQRSLRTVRMRLERGVEPENVRGRHRPYGRAGMATEHDPAEVFSTNCHRNRQTKVRRTEPFFLVVGARRGRNLIEPHLFRVERRTAVPHGRGRFLGETLKVRSV